MKTNYISHRNTALRLTIVCLSLIVGGLTVTSEAKPNHAGNGTDAAVRSGEQPARLIIRRVPNLGNNVIVDLSIDGAPFASVVYGETFEGALPAGRHVLSVEATPRPTYATLTSLALDAQSGKTYTFTAKSNGSGNLILQ